MRGIDLFDPFFALPELGAPATQILPQLPLNEGRLNADEDVQDADSETQGATLLHEVRVILDINFFSV
jgi:hypothetical protein